MSSGSAPAPPDYASAAEETSSGNLDLARYTTNANRADQVSPWGATTWNKTGGEKVFDQAGYDAALLDYNRKYDAYRNPGYSGNAGDDGGVQVMPRGSEPVEIDRDKYYSTTPEDWTQTTTLTPELQRALDAQVNTTANRSEYADALLGRVQSSYAQPFKAPNLADYTKGVTALDQSQAKASDYTKDVPGLNYNSPELAAYMNGVPGLDYNNPEQAAYFNDVKAVDQDGPQFDPTRRDAYSKAAFDASDSLLSRKYAGDEQKLRDSLALQGLNPMSQASGGATGSFYDSKNAAYNQLANQSVLTGSQLANSDFASQLAGFQATNQARGQAFGQANQGYANALQQYAASNAVRQQGLSNAQDQYSAALQGYGAQNAVRQQGQQNALANMGADVNSRNSANTARNQAYANALNRYQNDYQSKVAERQMPLNEMNALLSGTQVQAPQFSNYALQGNTQAADYSTAAGQQYNAALGGHNAEVAQDGQTTGAVMSAAGIAAAVFL